MVIERNRTIRPSTRLGKSTNYKIDTKMVSKSDILVVNIDHETKPFFKSYRFKGADVANKNSISFKVNDSGTSIEITWSGTQPIQTNQSNKPGKVPKQKTKWKPHNPSFKSAFQNLETSFEPISDSATEILILGTFPGNPSLKLGEYYGNPRNRFWKIISTITNNELPASYSEKKKLLLRTKIGIWDVAHIVTREGSLDSAIVNEEPNDIDSFIAEHKNLKIIGFNGLKSEALYKKYFNRKPELKYISLPSTSPANAVIDFDNICKAWQQILSLL